MSIGELRDRNNATKAAQKQQAQQQAPKKKEK
jgi:hypothetical protein